MTAPLPTPRTSPTAGLFNAFVRHLNRRYRNHIADLRQQLGTAQELNQQLKGGVS